MFIYSWWMTKLDGGRDGKPLFLQPHPALWWKGPLLSRWTGCFCDLAFLWFRVCWASLKLRGYWIPVYRWLLTLRLHSLTFLVFLTVILSGQSLARRHPAAGWSLTAMHMLTGLPYPATGLEGPPAPPPVWGWGGGWKTVALPSALCLRPPGSHGLQ